MVAQLLIYETVVPISAARHKNCAVDRAANFGFSAKINSVPLMAVEFPQAAAEYAIVFSGNEDQVMPVVILGVRDSENLYLDRDQHWQAQYVPAFVRRYPFVFSQTEDQQRFVLCIDEAFQGFNWQGRGQRLFDDEQKPTAYVEEILKFLQNYQARFERTRAFCDKIKQLDLLEPMQAQVEMNGGQKVSLGGFMAVNRAKLKALEPEKLAELAQTDELELLYLHLFSMRHFQKMPERLAMATAAAAAPAPSPELAAAAS